MVTRDAHHHVPRCVLVIGAGRSGTSALGWALAQHPSLWTSSEADFVHGLFGDGRLAAAYQSSRDASGATWLRVNDMEFAEFCRHIGEGVNSMMQSRAGGRVWVDATPSNALMARDLPLLFPDARFLHIIRDGREVVESLLSSGFRTFAAMDFRLACEYWRDLVTCGLELERLYSDRVLRVRHERMSADPAACMREVLAFLGVAQSDLPAEFLRSNVINSSFAATASERSGDRGQGVTQQRVQRWSTERRCIYEQIAGPLHRQLFGC